MTKYVKQKRDQAIQKRTPCLTEQAMEASRGVGRIIMSYWKEIGIVICR